MIGYVTLGTNDLPRAAAFYDALLADMGARRLWESPTGIGWGVSMDKPALAVMKLALGGTDEGAAGPRGSSFYCGYFRDLDDNKLNIFCMTAGG